jgi:hypothetical protein
VREGIAVLTDTLDVNVLGNDARASESYGATPLQPPPVKAVPGETEADRVERQVSMGLLNPNYATASTLRQQSALSAVEGFSAPATPPLFPHLPDVLSPRVTPAQPVPQEHQVKYLPRTDLGIPSALMREELPNLAGSRAHPRPAKCASLGRLLIQINGGHFGSCAHAHEVEAHESHCPVCPCRAHASCGRPDAL